MKLVVTGMCGVISRSGRISPGKIERLIGRKTLPVQHQPMNRVIDRFDLSQAVKR